MKKVLVQGVLGGLQEMVQLDSGLIVPKKVAEEDIDRQIKEMEELRDRTLASLYLNQVVQHPTLN